MEALSLLRQHSTRLSMDTLLGFLYESCQELGLIKELLRLPLSLTEQVGGLGGLGGWMDDGVNESLMVGE